MGAHYSSPAVICEVDEIIRREPVVDGYQHRAQLWHGVIRFELRVGVGGDVGDAITLPHSELLQRCRPPITALKEFVIGQTNFAVNHRLTRWIKFARAACEIQWC